MVIRQKGSNYGVSNRKVVCSNCLGECTAEETVKGIVVYRCLPCARIEKAEKYNKK